MLATCQGLQKYLTPCHTYETNKNASCYEVPRDVLHKFTKVISAFKMSVGSLNTEECDFIFTDINTTAFFVQIFAKLIHN